MSTYIAQIFGTIGKPPGVSSYTSITVFISNILRLLIVLAGVYALLNFIIAGYGFMSAGGDPGKIANAWAKIWQTAAGLMLAIGGFVLGSVLGYLLYDDPTMFFKIVVYGP